MELYIKDVSDITYESKLIPLHSCRMQECRGINSRL